MFRWTLYDLDSNITQVLRKDPRGWQDLTLTHQRDEKWHGVHYDFTTELGFFCQGAGKELVDDAYDLKGQEANVRVKLEVKCNGDYTTILEGKLNFSTYRQEWIAGVLYTFMDAEKDDIKQKLNNREDLEIDLLQSTSLDGVVLNTYPYSAYELSMHSKVIRLRSEWENTTNTRACIPLPSALTYLLHIAEFTKVGGELRESNDVPAEIESLSVFDTEIPPLLEFDDSYSYPFNITVNYDVHGWFTDISCTLGSVDTSDCSTGTLSGIARSTGLQNNPNTAPAQGWLLLLKVGQNFNDATGWILTSVADYSTLLNTYTDSFGNTGSLSPITVNRGDKVWLMWSASYNPVSAMDAIFKFEYSVCDISIVADTTTTSSTATGIAIFEAWSRLCERITDQTLAFRSDLFRRG